MADEVKSLDPSEFHFDPEIQEMFAPFSSLRDKEESDEDDEPAVESETGETDADSDDSASE